VVTRRGWLGKFGVVRPKRSGSRFLEEGFGDIFGGVERW